MTEYPQQEDAMAKRPRQGDSMTERPQQESAESVAAREGRNRDDRRPCDQSPCGALAIVVPCFDEEEVLPTTFARLGDVLAREVASGTISSSSALVFVDDGSSDRTWSLVQSAHARDSRIRGVKLAHNRGHQNALMAGLAAAYDAGFDCMASIDADLQDDEHAIGEMLAQSAAGVDIVYGVRDDRRTDGAFKRGTAEAFYALMRWLGVEMIPDAADFRLMSRRSVAALLEYQEVNLFLRGIVPQLGFATGSVAYARRPREAGHSKYPLTKMVALALNGITSFSIRPIRFVAVAGFVFVMVGIAMLIYSIAVYRHGLTVPGWTSLMVTLWVVGGAIMLSLGIVGEYIGRIYLEVKRRPRYVVEESLGFSKRGQEEDPRAGF